MRRRHRRPPAQPVDEARSGRHRSRPCPDPDVGLVTVTIGGNDVGFSEIVAQCVLGDCSGVPTSAGFQAKLDALSTRLIDEVYPALEAAYPNAMIVQVAYPRLTPLEGPPVGCFWLTEPERAATVEVVDRLDEAIGPGGAAGDVFVDITDALAGHELCTEDPWVEPGPQPRLRARPSHRRRLPGHGRRGGLRDGRRVPPDVTPRGPEGCRFGVTWAFPGRYRRGP